MTEEKKDFSDFEEKVGVFFGDKELLEQAFTHRSYLNERKSGSQKEVSHNERLEFLGDAVLELAVTEYLFSEYPEKPEGELTSLRAALVNTGSLSAAAERLGMEDFLLLSLGEAKDKGRAKEKILADTFEALVGAMYLDKGYEIVKKFISQNVLIYLKEILEKGLWQDSKSKLQETAQEKLGVTPYYEVVSEKGPDHDKVFTVGVYFGDDLIQDGDGKSKQEAEQSAAFNALQEKDWSE